ncbi:MAG TPA: alpha/beta fold hydrolase [Stellaceae bacterium]|nr:alpha/beta fold hydrolase [Stellaceae bacterium]
MINKAPLILLPGLLCGPPLWALQIAALADIADAMVPDLTHDDSFPGMARRVLAEAPERFALAGLSMGGYVAQEIMRQAPARVTRLALLDTSARADLPEQAQRRRDLIELSRRGQFHGVTPRLLPNLIHPDRLEDKALVKIITDMADAVGAEGFRRQETAILNRADGRPDLARIAVPTLILCGREDRLTPVKVAEEMAALIPQSRFAIVEHCGHMTTLERPDAVNEAMRQWLA